MSSSSLIQSVIAFFAGALLCGVLVSGCSDGGLSNYESNVESLGGNYRLVLDLSSTKISDDDLKSLEFPASLTEINLANTQISDDGVAELKRAKNLQTVVLSNTQITGKAIDHLKAMPSLRGANIVSRGIPIDEIHSFTRHLNRKAPTQQQRDTYELPNNYQPEGQRN